MRKDCSLVSFYQHLSTLQYNSNTTITGLELPHQDVDLSETSGNGPLYTFESCTFTSLSNSGSSGAITCSTTSSDYYKPQLIIKESSFKSCRASSGYGGGVYINGLPSSLIHNCFFTHCNSSNAYAGGLYFNSAIGLPSLTENTFISCYARQFYIYKDYADDGGGIVLFSSLFSREIQFIIQSCHFISCGCYGWGAGGSLGFSSALVGCTDSLFSSCECSDAEGLGIDLGTTNADCLIHFCYFSCSSGTTYPTDISINSDVGSFSDPFLHSFSTKDKAKSLRTLVKWSDNGYPNWLPHAFN